MQSRIVDSGGVAVDSSVAVVERESNRTCCLKRQRLERQSHLNQNVVVDLPTNPTNNKQ